MQIVISFFLLACIFLLDSKEEHCENLKRKYEVKKNERKTTIN
jgi:hypothetical protein